MSKNSDPGRAVDIGGLRRRRSTATSSRRLGSPSPLRETLSYVPVPLDSIEEPVSESGSESGGSTAGGKRHASVVDYEKSPRAKAIAIGLYMFLFACFTSLTSLSFFDQCGLVPTAPDSSKVLAAFKRYENATAAENHRIQQEMEWIALSSSVDIAVECTGHVDFTIEQQASVLSNSLQASQTYCVSFVERLWDTIDRAGLMDAEKEYPTCPGRGQFIGSEALQYYRFWMAKPQTSTDRCLGSIDPVRFPEHCLFSVFLMNRPQLTQDGCGENYEFDQWYNVVAQASNSRRCLYEREDMIEFALTFFPSNDSAYDSESFQESLQARLKYDRDYFLATYRAKRNLRFNAGISLSSQLQSINAAYDARKRKIDYQIGYMNEIYSVWSVLYDLTPSFLRGPSFSAPNTSIPPIPEVELTRIETSLDTVAFEARLDDYDPPVVRGLNPVIINTSQPEFEPNFPNITLSDSTLTDELTVLLDSLISFVQQFARIDLILRACFWLRELGQLLIETRRDMSTMRSQVKRVTGTILSHSVLILYLSVFLWLGRGMLNFITIDIDSVSSELYISCSNDVQTTNVDILADYQVEAANQRAQCNTDIAVQNNYTRELNTKLIGGLEKKQAVYESFYTSNNKVERVFLFPDADPLDLINFSVPFQGHFVDKGFMSSFVLSSDIETYIIDDSGCTNTTEARESARELNELLNQSKAYIKEMATLAIVLNVATRLFAFAMRNMMWMYLTTGYTFDAPFNRDALHKRIRQKRYQAGVFFVLVLALLLFAILSGASY